MATNYQGGDQVFNYAPLRQDALRWQANQARQEQAAAKSRETAAKQAADMVAKINPNGLRDADIPEFSKMYEKFRSAAIGVSNAGSIQERAKASAELQNQLTGLQMFVNSSKNQANVLKEFGTRLSSNPYRASDTQFSRFDQVTKLPTSQLQNIDLGNEFKLGARPEIWERFVKQAGDEVQKEASQLAPQMRELGYIRENGRTVKRYQDVANIPAQAFVSKLANIYQSNPEARDYVNEQARQQGITPEQFIARNVEANKDRLTWASSVRTQDLTPRKTSGSGSDDPSSYGSPTVREFTGTPSGTQQVRRFISPQFLSYNGGTISTPQLKAVFNITEGKTQPTVSLKNAEVTGVGYFPRYVNGKDVMGKGITVSALNDDKEVVEYFISEDKIPYDFKDKKAYKAASSALGQFRGTTNQTQNNRTTSTPIKGKVR